MMIAMPTDRERLGSSSRQWAKLPASANFAEAVKPREALAVWCITCCRFAGQPQLVISAALDPDGMLAGYQLDLPASATLASVVAALQKSPVASNVAFVVGDDDRAQDANVELELRMLQVDDAFRFELAYDGTLYEERTAKLFFDLYLGWLRLLLAQPATPIDTLEMLTPNDRQLMAGLLDTPAIEYPPIPIPFLIFEQANRTPNALAASFKGEDLSYAELLRRSAVLAGLMRAEGVQLGSVVAVCVPPGFDILVAMLAIWRLGGIYCPLDPTHPDAYVQHMLELAEPVLVLLHVAVPPMPCLERQRCLKIDGNQAGAPDTNVVALTLDRPAYLFFTSGTTGKPKGVLASHRNLAQYMQSAQKTLGFVAQDVFISIARYTFSISLFELVSPLCVGGRVILTERHEILNPERLLFHLQEVTVLHTGPSLLAALFRYLRSDAKLPQTLPHLRHASSGGDVVTASIMEDMKRVFDQAEIFVLYGSTEIACMGTLHAVSRAVRQQKSLVGKAFPGVKVRVLDERLRPQAFGVTGEICFAGPGLALGYYRRPEFEQDKFVLLDGERYYRMGDLGRLDYDGRLEMLGRADYQIQLRGIRIELVGIETKVRELGLAHLCAIVHKKADDQEALLFYVVGPKYTDIADFRRELAQHLPDFMLPQQLVTLEKMPLTVNGKLDRAALQSMPPPPPVVPLKNASASPPGSDARVDLLIAAFANVLQRPTIGVDQNFFDQGGHSMMAILLLQNLRDQFNYIIPPQVFFEHPTVRDVLRFLDGDLSEPLRPILLNGVRDKPKLFMLAAVQTYRPLAKKLLNDFAVYAVFTPEELSATEANSESLGIERLADHYLNQIRTVQPTGPYHILGYSFAGIVAYEVAQKLEATSEAVDLLVLVDAIIPEWNRKWTFRWRQLRRMMRRPARDVVAFLGRRLQEKFQTKGNDLNQFRDDPKLGVLQDQRILMKSIAAVNYLDIRKPYDHPCLLIISEDRLRRDPLKSRTCGWAEVIPQLEVQAVEGDHFKMVEFEPDVSQIADMVLHHYRERMSWKGRGEFGHDVESTDSGFKTG